MTREKKLLLNSVTSLVYQIVLIICGFVVPRLLLGNYGSRVYGLTASITQFLTIVTLLDCGVGAVVQSALYQPLAEKNTEKISQIVKSSDNFFNKIALILGAYTLAMVLFYPRFVSDDFGVYYTVALILSIALSIFAQYFFGMTYRLLLYADQKSYVYLCVQTLVVLLNTLFTVVLIKMNCSIQTVKFVASFCFFLTPVFLRVYVRKNYVIEKNIEITEEPIAQKWNGLAQHIAYFVHTNTDVVVLTVLSTLENVSIYNVYHLVTNGLYSLVNALTAGIRALLGNMYAKKEELTLRKTFNHLEWIIHSGTILLFTCAGILIVPFVRVYTSGIEDTNYCVPLFAYLITIGQAILCLQFPYNTMVQAAGHFKQTQHSSIIEAALNILISVLAVFKYGLVGVAIGTVCAMTFRMVYLVLYLRTNIIYRSTKYFLKQLFVDLLNIAIILTLYNLFASNLYMATETYLCWSMLAIKVVLLAVVVEVLTNLVFYPQNLNSLTKRFTRRKQ